MGDFWSIWSPLNTLKLEGLNEHQYSLSAQSRYLSDDISPEKKVSFKVDAIQPNSLLLYPKKIERNPFIKFNVSLYAHDLPKYICSRYNY